ncbi:MAG: tetratricopeptide repeat protein [Bacteroidetes bacterium]|nr:tetratricopeptide repeat protein [Fibrella sp.]
MNHNRIQLLRQYIQEEPGDPFNVYALAMEFRDHHPAQSRALFDQLLTEHPDYLATYYHAAALYADLDERPKATRLYEQGIDLARRQGNDKTLLELQRAKRAFEEDDV